MSGELILVVDDNPINLKLARAVLRNAGYAVETALDAEAAFEAVARSLPALVLTDLMLPGIDGFQLTAQLKHDPRYRAIPVIACTASALYRDEERARAAGCDAYLTKPFDLDKLVKVIAGFVRSAG